MALNVLSAGHHAEPPSLRGHGKSLQPQAFPCGSPNTAVQAGLASFIGCLALRHRKLKGREAAVLRANTRPFPEGVYNVESAADYFQTKPFQVAGRAAELMLTFTGFASGLLLDKVVGQLKANEDARAAELVKLLIRLGPTFIKIGQAASIRADLLAPSYLRALVELQDAVPPFPTDVATEIIERELGRPLGEIFEDISEAPVASASLGQVYKAQLRDGPEVAVKVQRPGMEDIVGLDLYLLRLGAPVVKQVLTLLAPVNQDLIGLIDAWGEGFVGELDYIAEASNAQNFMAAIAENPLAGAVTAPQVINECTSLKVLTTEWVVGYRLQESPASEVNKLCSVAMNSYLTMLLEFGCFHADPHPGNLMVTRDGRLCILDWGLVTKLDDELQIRMIEHVSNLVSREYGELGSELIDLGFVPEGKENEFRGSEVQSVLANAYDMYSDGGGAAKFDVGAYLDNLQSLGSKYGSIFRVPPYFFYIARAFIVLEGIGLSNDAEYSILGECLPYVSRRLLSDKSPRAAKALTTFLYGKDKERKDRAINITQFERLSGGISSYTSATGGLKQTALPAADVVDEMAQLLLGAEENDRGSPTQLQLIVIEELAKVLGASARRAFVGLGLPSVAGVSPDDADKKALETAERLAALAEPQVEALISSFQRLPADEQRRVATEVLGKLWNYRGSVAATGGRVALKTMAQGLLRLSQELR